MAKITEIVLFHSNDTGDVPTSSQLIEGEIALNTADKRLFTEDAAAAVVETVFKESEFSPDYGALLAEVLSVLHRVAITQAVPEIVDNTHGEGELTVALANVISRDDAQLFYQNG